MKDKLKQILKQILQDLHRPVLSPLHILVLFGASIVLATIMTMIELWLKK